MASKRLSKCSLLAMTLVSSGITAISLITTLKTKSTKPLFLMLVPVYIYLLQNTVRDTEQDMINSSTLSKEWEASNRESSTVAMAAPGEGCSLTKNMK